MNTVNTILMRSPEGEAKEVEAPSEELARLMNAGWQRAEQAPRKEPEGAKQHVASKDAGIHQRVG